MSLVFKKPNIIGQIIKDSKVVMIYQDRFVITRSGNNSVPLPVNSLQELRTVPTIFTLRSAKPSGLVLDYDGGTLNLIVSSPNIDSQYIHAGVLYTVTGLGSFNVVRFAPVDQGSYNIWSYGQYVGFEEPSVGGYLEYWITRETNHNRVILRPEGICDDGYGWLGQADSGCILTLNPDQPYFYKYDTTGGFCGAELFSICSGQEKCDIIGNSDNQTPLGCVPYQSGEVYIRGPRGYTGIDGPEGIQGPRGYTGYDGIQGPRGYTGYDGAPGAAGIQGPKGDLGIQGPKGDQPSLDLVTILKKSWLIYLVIGIIFLILIVLIIVLFSIKQSKVKALILDKIAPEV